MPRPTRAVSVDGTSYPNAQEAIDRVPIPGGNPSSLKSILNQGKTRYKGHKVAYTDEVEQIMADWKKASMIEKPSSFEAFMAKHPIRTEPLCVFGNVGTRVGLMRPGYKVSRQGTYREQRV